MARLSLSSLPGAQSDAEERANSLSHGVGALVSLAGLVLLVTYAGEGDAWRFAAVTVYGLSLVLVFASSTAYHAVTDPGWKRFFWVLDHLSIYLLIAGTYTPFMIVSVGGTWGWTVFAIEWALALVGIVYKLFFIGRFPNLSVALYLGMGWTGLLAVWPILHEVALPAVGLLIAGGLLYTGGVPFYRWFSLRFHHLYWHLFVIGGATLHWFAVWAYVLPPVR